MATTIDVKSTKIIRDAVFYQFLIVFELHEFKFYSVNYNTNFICFAYHELNGLRFLIKHDVDWLVNLFDGILLMENSIFHKGIFLTFTIWPMKL